MNRMVSELEYVADILVMVRMRILQSYVVDGASTSYMVYKRKTFCWLDFVNILYIYSVVVFFFYVLRNIFDSLWRPFVSALSLSLYVIG